VLNRGRQGSVDRRNAALVAFYLGRRGVSCHSDPDRLAGDILLLLGEDGAADRHDQGDDAVDALAALVLGGLEVTSGILGDGNVGSHPADHTKNMEYAGWGAAPMLSTIRPRPLFTTHDGSESRIDQVIIAPSNSCDWNMP